MQRKIKLSARRRHLQKSLVKRKEAVAITIIPTIIQRLIRLRARRRRHLQKGSSIYENVQFFYCGKVQTNHYFYIVVPGSKIRFENKKTRVVERQCACYVDLIREMLPRKSCIS